MLPEQLNSFEIKSVAFYGNATVVSKNTRYFFLNSFFRREKLAVAIENENYIKKLIKIFHMCEVFVCLEFFLIAPIVERT